MTQMFDLDRFVKAQQPVIEQVRRELAAGRKRSHWMWFVFPQLRGLGRSETAQFYGLDGMAEATEFLQHPVLGERLVECTRLVCAVRGLSVSEIFGYPDDLKFRSCMSLFAAVPDAPDCFRNALQRYFEGRADLDTLELLGR